MIDNTKNEEILKASNIIKDGGIVVFPTETVYGIGTDALNNSAIEKLYNIKKRPHKKPISVLVSDFEMITKVAKEISDIEWKIIKNFFPGPLTIVLTKKESISNILTGGEATIGVRMPDNQIALKLIEYVGKPVATSSANISGEKSGIDIENIKKTFVNKVDYYLEGKYNKTSIPSTVIKVKNGEIEILREGTITKKQIENLL